MTKPLLPSFHSRAPNQPGAKAPTSFTAMNDAIRFIIRSFILASIDKLGDTVMSFFEGNPDLSESSVRNIDNLNVLFDFTLTMPDGKTHLVQGSTLDLRRFISDEIIYRGVTPINIACEEVTYAYHASGSYFNVVRTERDFHSRSLTGFAEWLKRDPQNRVVINKFLYQTHGWVWDEGLKRVHLRPLTRTPF